MKRQKPSTRLAALALSLALLTGCAPAAASMHLRKAEGAVEVADEKGKTVELQEELGLYSGYGVDTEAESYAWIDLDSVKLAKLDENSDISIEKSGKKLEIVINRGSVYFDVTEPLADDETMEIRASDLLVGIRGTCGWVDAEQERVGLLRGKVACGETEVSAGELAERGEDGNLTVREMTLEDVPDFVRKEVDEEDLPEGRRKLIWTYLYHVNTSSHDERAYHIYGEDGHLARVDTYRMDADELIRWSLYTRDDAGKNKRIESYDSDGNLTGYTEYFYDEAGKVHDVFNHDPDGTQHHHTIFDNDAPIEDTADGMTTVYKRFYNDNGQLVRTETYRHGRLENRLLREYGADGRWVQEVQYYTGANGIQRERSTVRSYDEEGYLARADTYLDGDPQYYYLYEYE